MELSQPGYLMAMPDIKTKKDLTLACPSLRFNELNLQNLDCFLGRGIYPVALSVAM